MNKISFLLLSIAVLIISCQNAAPERTYSQAQIDSLQKVFNQYKQEKDREFKEADWSPLTPEDKRTFRHLNYFPYDISWRFEGPIHLYRKMDSITVLGTRSGDVRPALRYGYFEFRKDGKTYRLEIIKILPQRPGRKAHLFLGFWDETSGKETYAGGRYIDLEENKENHYVVDFNFAYNPYCAYSHRYSCAIPPLENRLLVAVTAGEKNYSHPKSKEEQ